RFRGPVRRLVGDLRHRDGLHLTDRTSDLPHLGRLRSSAGGRCRPALAALDAPARAAALAVGAAELIAQRRALLGRAALAPPPVPPIVKPSDSMPICLAVNPERRDHRP